jgi:hypothetical protein
VKQRNKNWNVSSSGSTTGRRARGIEAEGSASPDAQKDHARATGYRPCGVCLPATYASWKAQLTSVQGASAIRVDARILLAAGMDIVSKQTKQLALGEGDHMRAWASSLAVIDWRSANSEP